MSPILKLLIISIIWKAVVCGKLVSLNKSIRSSSTHTAPGQNWDPRNAVDGNHTNTPDQCKCCAATRPEHSPWFELDLGREFLIERIDVVGRSKYEVANHNLNKMQIFLAPRNKIQRAETTVSRKIFNFNFSLPEPKPSRYITLSRDIGDYFVICELSVYGDCVDGDFGQDCRQSCHCEGNPCNKQNGICPSGKCLPGFTTQTCNRKCNEGRYGQDCKETCGKCFDNATCNNVNGTCAKCANGYKGPLCKNKCEQGEYGSNCKEKCGQCKGKAVCNFMDGSCPDGCQPGYTNITCKTPCGHGKYGEDCKETCGHCKNRETCNPVTGTCTNKCEAGYTGELCKTACTGRKYGEECAFNCGKCRDNLPCNVTTGACDNGCNPGYVTVYCNKTCEDGNYGDGCNKSCGKCRNGMTCRKTDGHCTVGCLLGKQPPLCQTDCKNGTYGENCASKCGHCINGTTCDIFAGNCSDCEKGYHGVKCLPVLSQTSVGEAIGKNIVYILAAVAVVLVVVVAIIIWIRVKRRRANTAKNERPTSTTNDIGTISTLNRAEERQSIRPPSVKYENMATLTMNQTAVKPAGETKTTKDDENQEDVDIVTGPLVSVGDDHEYYAFAPKDTDIKIHQLWDYIMERKKQENDSFQQEFSQLPQGLKYPHKVALLEVNQSKNRYKGLYAYDHSRVPLKAEEGESEYINACFIDGYDEPKRFIASQGPTTAMRDDFWRMIWQQKSKQVVMLTNLVEMGNKKCLIYWPEEGEVTYGKIKIRLQSEETLGDFVIRKLEVQKGTDAPIIVTQYHFKAWPDKDVPDTTWSLIKFWRAVVEDRNMMKSREPIIVHCSAGIGRTGAFIALDCAYTQAKLEGMIRTRQVVASLREQRVNMVQTLQQYIYVHEALADAVLIGTHHIIVSQFNEVYEFLKKTEMDTKIPRLRTQFDLLLKSIEDKYHGEKNAEDKTRTETLSGAVFLPNSLEKDVFIAMKTPKESAITEFWSLIKERSVKTIVSLGAKENADKGRTCFHLDPKLQSMYKLSLVEETGNSGHIERKLAYISQAKEELTIKQFECAEWTSNGGQPIEPSALIDLLENVFHWQKELSDTHPVLVHCPSGAEFSGVVCVLINELNKMKKDGGVLNVLQSVKTMKSRNRDIIPTYEQYLFLFEVIHYYLDGGNVYANV